VMLQIVVEVDGTLCDVDYSIFSAYSDEHDKAPLCRFCDSGAFFI